MRPESQRIEFLLRRDGYDETLQWVQRTAGMYRRALMQRSHYAADPAYRPLFEKAVREFEEWLAHALVPSPARRPIANATAPGQAAS